MIHAKTLTVMAILALSASALAEELRISASELENLGVRFASPERATEVAGIEATARVVIPPAGDAVVGTPHAGLLTGLEVAVGDPIVEGQVLAELRSPDFIELQREFLDEFNTYLLAQNEYERDQQLYDEGIISARRLQETTTRSRIAETHLNEHRQLLKIAGLSDADIRSLEETSGLLESLEIRAPFDGVIIDRMATTGQRLDAMSPIYRLADLSELWLEINVPQEQVAGIEPGMRVAVTGRAEEYTAVVTTIGRAIDPSTQFVTVRARLEGGSESLSPGQFISVRIVAVDTDAFANGVWAVPVAAVTRSGDASFIFVQSEAGVDVRRVDVVSASADRVYIVADLDAGSMIVVSGVSALKALWAATGYTDS